MPRRSGRRPPATRRVRRPSTAQHHHDRRTRAGRVRSCVSRRRVETPRRLAGDDDDRFVVQFTSRDELLGVTTRQRIGELFGCPLDRPRLHPLRGHGIASDPPRGAPESEVVVASHRADEGTQRPVGRDVGDALGNALAGGQPADVLTVDLDRARVRDEDAGDAPTRARPARSRRHPATPTISPARIVNASIAQPTCPQRVDLDHDATIAHRPRPAHGWQLRPDHLVGEAGARPVTHRRSGLTTTPLRITATRSAASTTSRRRWVISTTARPSVAEAPSDGEQAVRLGVGEHCRRLVEQKHLRVRRRGPEAAPVAGARPPTSTPPSPSGRSRSRAVRRDRRGRPPPAPATSADGVGRGTATGCRRPPSSARARSAVARASRRAPRRRAATPGRMVRPPATARPTTGGRGRRGCASGSSCPPRSRRGSPAPLRHGCRGRRRKVLGRHRSRRETPTTSSAGGEPASTAIRG